MDIFVSGIPVAVPEIEVRETIAYHLGLVGVCCFDFKTFFSKDGKRCGNLTVTSKDTGKSFIFSHGRAGLGSHRVIAPIKLAGRRLEFKAGHEDPDPFVLKRLRREEAANRSKGGTDSSASKSDKTALVVGLEHGFLDFEDEGQLVFNKCYSCFRPGKFVTGRKRLLVLLDLGEEGSRRARILIEYSSIQSIFASSSGKPSLFLTLYRAPLFYEDAYPQDDDDEDGGPDKTNELTQKLHSLGLSGAPPEQQRRVDRKCNLGNDHAVAAASCYTYVIRFENYTHMNNALRRLKLERSAPKPTALQITPPTNNFSLRKEFSILSARLGDASDLPFSVKFQLQMLACNGIINPRKVRLLIEEAKFLLRQIDEVRLSEGIKALRHEIPFAGPGIDPNQFRNTALVSLIKKKASAFPIKTSIYRLARKYEHLALVYKAFVSPAGLWLEGPGLEIQNRVLRKYPNNLDHFMRINFCDEDGEQVRYEYGINRDEIFHDRFRDVLSKGILVAGRHFNFLGFSHSSLRSQTCWFVAPFYVNEGLLLARNLIEDLGDFSKIFSPAKCAARIGQAFSDSTDTIDLSNCSIQRIPDIERNDRCFSDGVGTISFPMLREVWKRFARNKKSYAPVLQIRFQGCKGLLSLDARIAGNVIRYRPSMDKFPSPDHLALEITGAAHKPLPMYLNRQFINVLEGLGTDPETFMRLQRQALSHIERMTESPINAASYLEMNMFGMALGLPSLIRQLSYKGFHFKDDSFLQQAVEVATRVQLRELKHKGRILVPDAHTLYGIVDVTGYLQPNEVHVIIKEKQNPVVVRTGKALVTRAPAMHPGDFQFVHAVNVPEGSANEYLHNCVIFSKYGDRDIPSMLSGGDLDGDLFNVVFDSSLFPSGTYSAADYPRPRAIDIGRPITSEDMSNFFLQFMEQDKLGYICSTHMIIADQKDENVFHEACITLAGMASTAVDFSKTGIPVNMDDFPFQHINRRLKPDFMANAPHLILQPDLGAIGVDDDEMVFHDVFDDIDEALAGPHRATKYYESRKILGRLYRNVDETEFVKNMQMFQTAPVSLEETDSRRSSSLFLARLWVFILQSAVYVPWKTTANYMLALEIRDAYEEGLVDLMYQFSPHHRQPLSELEVICGTILGRDGALPSKRTREANIDMKESFRRHAQQIIRWVRKGTVDEEASEEDDADEDADWDKVSTVDSTILTSEQEKNQDALGRSIACLSIAINEDSQSFNREVGQLRSFAYLVAGICLKQLEKYEEMKRQMQRKENAALGGAHSTRGGRSKLGAFNGRSIPN